MAGAEGTEAQLCALCEAEEEERVGEAVRDEGLERRPRERKAAIPCEAPSGRMNFSRNSRLVRPRAALRWRDRKGHKKQKCQRVGLKHDRLAVSSMRGKSLLRVDGRASKSSLIVSGRQCMSLIRDMSSRASILALSFALSQCQIQMPLHKHSL